nr:MAG TPA: hypothetical protein [Caudoviricetes sp.]DAI94403.1 MAG TPA: hypothetical protein [Caudoviricetes sp.]
MIFGELLKFMIFSLATAVEITVEIVFNRGALS